MRNSLKFSLLFKKKPEEDDNDSINDPRDISNLWGWWPADNLVGQFSDLAGTTDAVTADGHRVSAVTDKAAGIAGRRLYLNGQNLTRRFVYKTGIQNGLPGWQAFVGDSTASAITTDDSLTTNDCTIVVACKTDTVSAGTTYGVVGAHHSTNGGVQVRVSGDPSTWRGRSNPTDSDTVGWWENAASNTAYVVAYTAVASPLKRRLINNRGGPDTNTSTAITSGNQAFRIGCPNNNNQNSPWHGYIFEVAVYSPAISDEDVAKIMQYLGNKWDI